MKKCFFSLDYLTDHFEAKPPSIEQVENALKYTLIIYDYIYFEDIKFKETLFSQNVLPRKIGSATNILLLISRHKAMVDVNTCFPPKSEGGRDRFPLRSLRPHLTNWRAGPR